MESDEVIATTQSSTATRTMLPLGPFRTGGSDYNRWAPSLTLETDVRRLDRGRHRQSPPAGRIACVLRRLPGRR